MDISRHIRGGFITQNRFGGSVSRPSKRRQLNGREGGVLLMPHYPTLMFISTPNYEIDAPNEIKILTCWCTKIETCSNRNDRDDLRFQNSFKDFNTKFFNQLIEHLLKWEKKICLGIGFFYVYKYEYERTSLTKSFKMFLPYNKQIVQNFPKFKTTKYKYPLFIALFFGSSENDL